MIDALGKEYKRAKTAYGSRKVVCGCDIDYVDATAGRDFDFFMGKYYIPKCEVCKLWPWLYPQTADLLAVKKLENWKGGK